MIKIAVAVLTGVLSLQAVQVERPRESASRPAAPQPSTSASPSRAAVDIKRLEAIEPLVAEAIAEKKLPGAVVLVGHRDRVLYQKAFGHRALVPNLEPM